AISWHPRLPRAGHRPLKFLPTKDHMRSRTGSERAAAPPARHSRRSGVSSPPLPEEAAEFGASAGERAHVHPHARPHAGADRYLLDVGALRPGGLRLDDGVGEHPGVLQQLVVLEARLADPG